MGDRNTTVSFAEINRGIGVGISNAPINATFHLPPERPETPPRPFTRFPFPRDPDFIERKALADQVHHKLSAPGARIALVGLGGVGKSMLAIEYAHDVEDNSPETWIFFLRASNAARYEQSVQKIVSSLRIRGHDNPKSDKLALFEQWLQDPKHGRWLLIVDNVDNARSFQEPASSCSETSYDRHASPHLWTCLDCLPVCRHGSILITSRDRNAARDFVHDADIITIPAMDEEHAVALFRRKFSELHSGEDIVELARALNFMPLALAQVAAYIKHRAPRCSVRQYLGMMQASDSTKIHLLKQDDSNRFRDGEASNSIIQTWQISFEHIHQCNPTAANLLSLMSFFDCHGIPEVLLQHCASSTSLDGDLRYANTTGDPESSWTEGLAQIEPQDWNRLRDIDENAEASDERWSEIAHDGELSNRDDSSDADSLDSASDGYKRTLEFASFELRSNDLNSDIKTLRDFSFISETEQPGILQMHRLVQLATQTWLETNGQLEAQRRQSILSLCTNYPPAENEDWESCQNLFPHVVLAVAKQPIDNSSQLLWASLLHNAAWYASRAGHSLVAKHMSRDSMKARSKLLGQENIETIRSMEMLGSIYYDERRLKDAEKLQRSVLSAREKVHGLNHPLTLASMSNLALTVLAQDRWDEAEVLQLRVLQGFRVFGETHANTLAAMAGLASTYHQQKRWQEAEDLRVQVFRTCEKLFGLGHYSTLESIDNLAMTYNEQGKSDDAEELLLQIVDICKKDDHTAHPSLLACTLTLARTYQRQRRWKEAEELEVQVLETRRKKLGDDHLDTLNSMSLLATTYRSQRRWKEAEELEFQALETRRKKLGDDHLDTLDSMSLLATTYWSQQRWKEAEELEIQVLEIRRKKLGDDHLDTLHNMSLLATTYWSQRRWTEAEELQVQVLETRRKKLGDDHLDTLDSMSCLATTYWSQQRWIEAEVLEVQVLETRRKKLGDDHLATLDSMNWLATIYRSQQRWKEAEELQVQVLETRREKLGDDHLDTLDSKNWLATIYRSQQR